MTKQIILHYLQRNQSIFQFWTCVELSRSMAAILEMPQYVAHQKNVVYVFITVLTFCAQWMCLAALLNRGKCESPRSIGSKEHRYRV